MGKEMKSEGERIKIENQGLRARADEHEYKCKDVEIKLTLVEKLHNEKSGELTWNFKMLEELKRRVWELETEVEHVRGEAEEREDADRNNIHHLQVSIWELTETVKTKDKMLDDKNDEIRNMKDLVMTKEEELGAARENRNEFKEELELKQQELIEENEKLKEENLDLDWYL